MRLLWVVLDHCIIFSSIIRSVLVPSWIERKSFTHHIFYRPSFSLLLTFRQHSWAPYTYGSWWQKWSSSQSPGASCSCCRQFFFPNPSTSSPIFASHPYPRRAKPQQQKLGAPTILVGANCWMIRRIILMTKIICRERAPVSSRTVS